MVFYEYAIFDLFMNKILVYKVECIIIEWDNEFVDCLTFNLN